LLAVVYGRETWFLILRRDFKGGGVEESVFRRTFGTKWDEVTGGWSKPHSEELRDLYTSPSIIRIFK
jgi:hypothetical protein